MRHRIYWLAFLALYFLAYASIFPGRFHYDDFHSIRDNSWLTSVSNIPKFFANPVYFSKTPRAAMYRPVLLLSYALDYQVFGWRAWGWHLTNLLLHLVNALLVYALVRKTLGRRRLAWIASLLFALQPIAGENINYINCRSSILLTTFLLAGLLCVWRLMQEKAAGVWWMVLACLFYALALLTKDSGAVFPGMALLYFWIFSREQTRQKFLRSAALLLPMAVILAGYLFLRNEFFESVFTGASLPRSRLDNLFTELKSYFWYFGLYLWPSGLSLEHGFRVEREFSGALVLLSAAGLAALAAMAGYALFRPRSRMAVPGFFIGCYILALLPTASIIPLNVLVSERALYPALFALASLGALFIGYVMGKNRSAGIFALALILVFYGAIIFSRSRAWQSESEIWKGAYENAPDNARVLAELGRQYFARGDLDKALRYSLKSDELASGQAPTLFNLATIYMDFGELARAEKYFKQGLEEDAGDVEARVNLAAVYKAEGKMEAAVHELKQALALDPENSLAHSNLGDVCFNLGKMAEAEAELRKALAINPKLELANFNFGILLAGRGDDSQALGYFEKAYEQNAGNADYALWAAIMEIRLNKPQDAEKWAGKALSLDPGYDRAWYYLGIAQKQQGRYPEARRSLANAEKFDRQSDPKLTAAIKNLLKELKKK